MKTLLALGFVVRALAADSHVMSGAFEFTVGSANLPADSSREHAGDPQH
jgi:hypothetical protein